jgi:uncharacterized nucleotidyltransferase DUF6036
VRELADADRIRRFMGALGRAAEEDTDVYFTGGATAVLLGWRPSTIDVDVLFRPEQDALLRALPALKDELRINVELASPLDFIPVPAGWEDRSLLAGREGRLTFRHFDPYGQALAKLERAHVHDLEDVDMMLDRGLVDPGQALVYLDEIEPNLYRYPAIDAASFRRRAEAALRAQR